MEYPSYCCQKCGECIGWIGRFIFPWFHKCLPEDLIPKKEPLVNPGIKPLNYEEIIFQSLVNHCYRLQDKHTHEDRGYNRTFNKEACYREIAKQIIKDLEESGFKL